ncbi:hypothetical protein F511_07640 [Dorcoceras hygrometricum]|uniref:Uncharacterized protein n=1 Tax=Dorcoceras hygrometricum TaxID=472368 RepID=A0A2Z7DH51_9LAMI|nr:hypothetical protein F511_07640 [Dorcoceras hygrometricum]
MVVSVIGGMTVEFSESVFAAAFGLPTEGLTDLSEVPKDLLSKAQRLFSASEKEVSVSCLKKEVKMQYHLLSDILAKSLFVKAGSFDAVTRDRFLLMTAITFDVKINWGNILFGVLKEMVTPDSRQAKGYAIQICALLKNISGLELGESKAFPAPRILNEKTVHRIVSVNENVGVEEVSDAPRAKPTPVKRTVSKKRQASIDADVAPIIKKKRTTKSKPVAAKKLVLEETIAAIPSTEEHLPVKEITTEDADATIRQVLTQLDLVFETQDHVQRGRDETWFDRAFDEAFVAGNQEDQASESLEHIFLELAAAETIEVGDLSKKSAASKRSFEEIMSVDDLLVQICDDLKLPSITDAEISKIKVGESIAMCDKGKGILVEDELIQSTPAQEAVEIICGDVEFLVELRDRVMLDVVEFFHSFSLNKLTDLDALLALKAKEKLMLEWAETDSLETAVKRRLFILSSKNMDLPTRAPEAAHTSAPVDSHVSSAALEDLRSYFSKRIDESTTELRSKVNEVEFNVRGDLVKQQAWLRQMFHSACDILERQSTQLTDLKKGLLAPVSTIFKDLLDLKSNDRAHAAKLNALDSQVAGLRNDQLEFQNRISADLLSLSTQFADIVEFIRGGDAKKGESGSSSRPPPVRVERRPLPIPPSPIIPVFPRTTGTLEERIEQARRHLLQSGLVISVEEAAERIRQADIQESDRLQRERERASREKRSSSSRRRRGS